MYITQLCDFRERQRKLLKLGPSGLIFLRHILFGFVSNFDLVHICPLMKWPLLAAKKSNTNILIDQYYTVKLYFLLHTVQKFKFLKYQNSNYDIATWKGVVELSSITIILQIKYCLTQFGNRFLLLCFRWILMWQEIHCMVGLKMDASAMPGPLAVTVAGLTGVALRQDLLSASSRVQVITICMFSLFEPALIFS